MAENADWYSNRLPVWMKMLRQLRPAIFRCYLPLSLHRRKQNADTTIAGLLLGTRLEVFHPRLYMSSRLFAAHLARLPLRGKRFLDMGTGSGIAGIIAAQHGAQVLAVDVNPVAVQLASENARRHGVEGQMKCVESDLFESVDPREQFDCIAFNPPYYAGKVHSAELAAWMAGEDYQTIVRFLWSAKDRLAPAGRIVLILSTDMPLQLVHQESLACGYHYAVLERRTHLFEFFYLLELQGA